MKSMISYDLFYVYMLRLLDFKQRAQWKNYQQWETIHW